MGRQNVDRSDWLNAVVDTDWPPGGPGPVVVVTLYPLDADGCPVRPVDGQGRPVRGFPILVSPALWREYCAGVAMRDARACGALTQVDKDTAMEEMLRWTRRLLEGTRRPFGVRGVARVGRGSVDADEPGELLAGRGSGEGNSGVTPVLAGHGNRRSVRVDPGVRVIDAGGPPGFAAWCPTCRWRCPCSTRSGAQTLADHHRDLYEGCEPTVIGGES